jgi:hypothetical protein
MVLDANPPIGKSKPQILDTMFGIENSTLPSNTLLDSIQKVLQILFGAQKFSEGNNSPWDSFVSKVHGLFTRTKVVHFKKAPHILLGGFVILVEPDRMAVVPFRLVVLLKYLSQDAG